MTEKRIYATDVVQALKAATILQTCKDLAATIGNTTPRAVATALRGPVNSNLVRIRKYKNGVALYEMTPKAES